MVFLTSLCELRIRYYNVMPVIVIDFDILDMRRLHPWISKGTT